MTDNSRPGQQRRRRPGPLAVAWVAGLAFLAGVGLLAMQLRAGRDPALSAFARRQAPPTRVVVHRIIKRRVIVEEVDDSSGGDSSSVQSTSSSVASPISSGAAAAPVTRSS